MGAAGGFGHGGAGAPGREGGGQSYAPDGRGVRAVRRPPLFFFSYQPPVGGARPKGGAQDRASGV